MRYSRQRYCLRDYLVSHEHNHIRSLRLVYSNTYCLPPPDRAISRKLAIERDALDAGLSSHRHGNQTEPVLLEQDRYTTTQHHSRPIYDSYDLYITFTSDCARYPISRTGQPVR